MKELINYLFKVCETALNETHDIEAAMQQMQNVINHYFTNGLYTTKQLYTAQTMLLDIVKCFTKITIKSKSTHTRIYNIARQKNFVWQLCKLFKS